MAFKKTQPPTIVPDSPEKVLLDLPRRKIPGVLLHQGEIMKTYVKEAINASDVALQLPTGSGKTLVGLMIAEWRRRKFQERVVYLCPTRQLVNQVVEQAEEQYGLTVRGFTGSAAKYNPAHRAEYQNAVHIAVTTYNSLFNTNPYFEDPQVIIVDDAHAAENYIAALWTLRIERNRPEHSILHKSISNLLKPLLDPTDYVRLTGVSLNITDATWVDKVPTPEFDKLRDEFAAIVDEHVSNLDLLHSWSMIRDHLRACQLYLSTQDILVRPLIPPTWTHSPFANAKQRIFMSATLGAGGDLERLTGRKKILRIPVPSGWDRQGIGRRYFIFPSMGLTDSEIIELRHELMKTAGRSLVLVPSDRLANEIEADVNKNLAYKVFSAEDIEDSKKTFVKTPQAVAVVANRYDGIDFPGDDCRLLFIDGLPRANNSQERFLMSRMGASILFNQRVQTRVLQAIGRCTRSLQDYSAVVVTGEELPNYLIDRTRRSYLHPELQGEIDFGAEQSIGSSINDLVENFSIFLRNDAEWEAVNNDILTKRDKAEQKPFPALSDLQEVVGSEIDFQTRLWQGDYLAAMAAAENVLANLKAPELQGYRALWHYLAGSAAWLGKVEGIENLSAKARIQFENAKEAARGIPWLVSLSHYHHKPISTADDKTIVYGQLEKVEAVLASLGKLHDRKYSQREKEILEGLSNPETFENAHRMLGELLGFDAGKEETDASPDPWWITGKICFVFEDHAGANDSSILDATKARQVASHPKWIEAKLSLPSDMQILPVLITPVSKASEGAMPHLTTVSLWPLKEFLDWATKALTIMRQIRRTFIDSGDLMWRAEAAEAFEQNCLDAPALYKLLSSKPATTLLKEVTI